MRVIRNIRTVQDVEHFLRSAMRELSVRGPHEQIISGDVQATLQRVSSARSNVEEMSAAINAYKESGQTLRGLQRLPEIITHGEAAVDDLSFAQAWIIRLQFSLRGIKGIGADEFRAAGEVLSSHTTLVKTAIARWRLQNEIKNIQVQENHLRLVPSEPQRVAETELRPAIFKEVERDGTLLPFDPSKRRTRKN